MARNLAEKTHLGRQVAMARLVCVFIALTSMAQFEGAGVTVITDFSS